MRAIAERKPHVEVAILRLQAIVGAGFRGALAELFSRDRIPVCPGFDPAVQMLHPDDAVAAIVWAAEVGLTGVFNVASSGLLRLGEAVRRAGGRRAVALPFAPPVGRAALRALGLAPVAGELYDLLRHGNAVDAGKLARRLRGATYPGRLPRRTRRLAPRPRRPIGRDIPGQLCLFVADPGSRAPSGARELRCIRHARCTSGSRMPGRRSGACAGRSCDGRHGMEGRPGQSIEQGVGNAFPGTMEDECGLREGRRRDASARRRAERPGCSVSS
ncbi:MAG: hypothetical protein R3E53_11740 [Myxococcota bacterium]